MYAVAVLVQGLVQETETQNSNTNLKSSRIQEPKKHLSESLHMPLLHLDFSLAVQSTSSLAWHHLFSSNATSASLPFRETCTQINFPSLLVAIHKGCNLAIAMILCKLLSSAPILT